jgi:short-subunit dehydrogenase
MESSKVPTKAPVVLVTGASAGLGLALARLLVRTDYRLILTARKSSLHRFAEDGIAGNARIWLRALDVTSAAERGAIVEEANERCGGVDVLVNNAGIAYRSVVEHASEEEGYNQMNINFRSPMELIRLVLPGMREKRRGRIINVSSVGGMMAMPTMALYSASKFALEGATESLWYEVRPWNIKVSLVQPGFIRSDSFQNTVYTAKGSGAAQDPANPYYQHYSQMADFIARLMRRSLATPETIAIKIRRTMERKNPPLRVPATFDANFFSVLRRVLPRGVYHWMLFRGLPKVKSWGPGPNGEQSSGSGSSGMTDKKEGRF